MRNATRFLTPDEKAAVESAIVEAEQSSAVEIVCAVATESGRYDRAESIVGLGVGVLALWLVNTVVGAPQAGSGAWGTGLAPFLWQVAAVVAGFVGGSVLASYVHPLRRMFTPAREMEQEVARAASHVFCSRRLTSTLGGGGVLIYVSLFERRVVVLADEGARNALGEDGIGALRDVAVRELRNGQRAGTLLETVRAAGQRLQGAFTLDGAEADELPNEVLLLHPRP